MLSQPIHTPHSKDGTGKGFSPFNIDTFFWNGKSQIRTHGKQVLAIATLALPTDISPV